MHPITVLLLCAVNEEVFQQNFAEAHPDSVKIMLFMHITGLQIPTNGS